MQESNKIGTFSFKVASLWSLGEWWLGGVIASSLAIPFLLLIQSLYWLSMPLFFAAVVFGSLFLFLMMQWAIMYAPEKGASVIVIDDIVGVMIAFAYVPLRWRVIVFGFILFHVLNKIRPFLPYRRIMRVLDRLPGVFGILAGDILSGLVVNVFLQLIAWVMG